jgi:23S rRNA (cytidine2498-2'-O)-methyltransferase
MSTSLLVLTRSGFEADISQELNELSAALQVKVELDEFPGGVFVRTAQADPVQADAAKQIWQALHDWRSDLIFGREVLWGIAELNAVPTGDRVSVIVDALANSQLLAGQRFAEVLAYAPDADSTRTLAPMTSSIQKALQQHLVAKLDVSAKQSLHVVFLASNRCVIAIADQKKSAPVAGGIPRLKFPPAAPSRSTLKLDEAFLLLMSDVERKKHLQRGMIAVDLGACPGGWTYQLVRRGLRVIAIDNGKIDDTLMRTGLVEHLRADGFRFVPKKPVDWMVCDMVEKPLRVAELAATWLKRGYCQHVIVNFKLPMKKRLAELQSCRALMQQLTDQRLLMRCKQLYHDREEVTAYLTLKSKPTKPSSSQLPIRKQS